MLVGAGFQMGFQPAVVIMDADVMHEALVKKAHCFSDRPLHLWMVKLLFGGNGTHDHVTMQ